MNALDAAAAQIGGAWKMAFNADDWRGSLDRSVDAVFASFWAMAMSAPFVILVSLLARKAALKIPKLSEAPALQAPAAAITAADLSAFAIEWIAGLVFILAIARAGGASRRAADIIVGYNWIQPITIFAQAPAVAVAAATGSAATGGLLGLPALILSLALYWGVIRRGLETAIGPTIAVVSMLFVIGLVIDGAASGLLVALFVDQ